MDTLKTTDPFYKDSLPKFRHPLTGHGKIDGARLCKHTYCMINVCSFGK